MEALRTVFFNDIMIDFRRDSQSLSRKKFSVNGLAHQISEASIL